MKWNELSLFDKVSILTIFFTIGLVTFSISRVGVEVLIGKISWEIGILTIGSFMIGMIYYHLIGMIKSCVKFKSD